MRKNINIKFRRMLIPLLVLTFFAVAVGANILSKRSKDDDVLSGLKKVAAVSNVNPCHFTENNQSRKCYKLHGEVYVATSKDTHRVISELNSYIKINNLDNNDGNFSKRSADEIEAKILESADNQSRGSMFPGPDQGSMIGLVYSGGLFGVYDFPHNKDFTSALYVATYSKAEGSNNDDNYVIMSEFHASSQEAKLIAKAADSLKADEYLLLVAK